MNKRHLLKFTAALAAAAAFGSASAQTPTSSSSTGASKAPIFSACALHRAWPEADLKLVQNAKDAKSLSKVIGKLHKSGTVVFFDYGPEQDFKDASRVIFAVHQAGLGMPEREYYLKTDKRSEELRTAYLTLVQTVFELLGEPKAKAKEKAAAVFAVEKALAEISSTKQDLREPQKNSPDEARPARQGGAERRLGELPR